ncbi:Hypothetical protein, putative [Bodo saltans]|uniref:Uncharacterized protein n=1 Tax=Bodo saltans TaxID=75058 RepID=A0A0S4IUT1_BODSA|nr:Hypothetical protein, putative [Bodo saltans]|eukprot:CUF38739.1 Hypothetical protein, putative [Bodo saltans]
MYATQRFMRFAAAGSDLHLDTFQRAAGGVLRVQDPLQPKIIGALADPTASAAASSPKRSIPLHFSVGPELRYRFGCNGPSPPAAASERTPSSCVPGSVMCTLLPTAEERRKRLQQTSAAAGTTNHPPQRSSSNSTTVDGSGTDSTEQRKVVNEGIIGLQQQENNTLAVQQQHQQQLHAPVPLSSQNSNLTRSSSCDCCCFLICVATASFPLAAHLGGWQQLCYDVSAARG